MTTAAARQRYGDGGGGAATTRRQRYGDGGGSPLLPTRKTIAKTNNSVVYIGLV
jgi:hypothetical protein